MNKIDYFKDLDLAAIKITVSNWAENFPTIKKTFLSLSRHGRDKCVIMAESYDSRNLEIIFESYDEYEDLKRFFKHCWWFLEFYSHAESRGDYDDHDPQWFDRFKKDFLNYAQERLRRALQVYRHPR
jgi:hypothetical protein